MATLGQLILDVEEMLYGMALIERPAEDVATLANDSATSMTVALSSNFWRRDDLGEIIPAAGAVGEIVRITADVTTATATVRRGQRNTTAAAASALPIRKNPRYPRVAIQRAIEETIFNLHPHVWYRASRSLTFVDQTYTYPLLAKDDSIIWMYQVVNDEILEVFNWRVVPVINSAVESSAKAIVLNRVPDITYTVYYDTRVKPLYADLADFPDELAALIPWAVCGRLLGGTRVAPHRADPSRQGIPDSHLNTPISDWRHFTNQYILLRGELRNRLRYEERELRQKRFSRRRGHGFKPGRT